MRVNDSHTSLGVYGYQHFAQIQGVCIFLWRLGSVGTKSTSREIKNKLENLFIRINKVKI